MKTINTKEMSSEQKNSLAYQDCVEYKEPSMPDDSDYMTKYQWWRNIAQFPEDKYEAY
jgi:hypothetical protein